MDTVLTMPPENICRTCLRANTDMKSLFSKKDGEQRTLLDMLSFISNMNISTGEKLPQHVCVECEDAMCKSDAFKRRCLESEAVLNKLLNVAEQRPISPQAFKNVPLKDDKSINPLFSSVVPFIPEIDTDIKHTVEISITGNVKKEVFDEIDGADAFVGAFDDFPLEVKQEDTKSKLKLYNCSCGLSFSRKDEYSGHTKMCKREIFKSKVGIRIKNSCILKDSYQVKCRVCNVEFSSVKAYRLHEKMHAVSIKDKSDEPYQCSMCMRKFSRKYSLTLHIQKHQQMLNVKHICGACKREFKHKAHLDNHILSVHTREKGFSCELCSKSFTTQESLDMHKDTHNSEKKHQCSMCDKAFYMLSTLTDHLRTHTGEKPFLCSMCGRGFSQKTNLAQHMRRHQGLKPFKCETCDRGFVSKGELDAHSRKHSGAHPFVCDECGGGFTTSSSLVKHRRIHTGERPYACDLCPMRFTASGTLKNHRRTHTGEKPYQCSYCEKAFVQRQDLVSHIRCHTGERPFVCSTCGQGFRKASALKAHVKMHSKDCQQKDLAVYQGVHALLTSMHDASPMEH